MSINNELSAIFGRMADGLELLGANPFRVNTYRRVSRTLRDLTTDLSALVEESGDGALKALSALQGVGKGTAQKILAQIQDGMIPDYVDLMGKIPPGLFEILQIPGLGPKAVKAMWDELHVVDMDSLKVAIETGALESLPRMGKKSVENIRQAMAFREKAGGRVSIGKAFPLAESIVKQLAATPGVDRAAYAGSLRRGRETVGDLDFLVATAEPDAVRDLFVTLPSVTQILAKGPTKCSVRLEDRGVVIQADLRLVDLSVWGAALLYFTGSKEHNVRLREIAIRENMRLNEYGLYRGKEERPQDRGEKPVAAESEEGIYQALGLPWIPPEAREDRWEFDGDLPELIEDRHVRSELHTHTRASDGKLEILELAAAARDCGLEILAITDHSAAAVIAGGLSADRLRDHMMAVRKANQEIEGIEILAGSEVDILPDGTLDYDDELLAALDIVVASPHLALRQEGSLATARLLKAIENPFTDIIGHPSGRLIGKRPGLDLDYNVLFSAAAANQTAMEINANPQRLDLDPLRVRQALEHQCWIAINTDAHDASHLSFRYFGILAGRRGSLSPDSCINCWEKERLLAWLNRNRQRKSKGDFRE